VADSVPLTREVEVEVTALNLGVFTGLDVANNGKVTPCALFTVSAVGSSRSPGGRLPNTGLRLGNPVGKW
jgi:hypothetical protein